MAGSSSKQTGGRLFIALDPPAEVRLVVAEWSRRASGGNRRMRPVPAGFLHITLAFLGEGHGSEVEAIGRSIEESASPVAGLSLGAPVWLPRRRPRVLALDVHDPGGRLSALQRRLAAALEEKIGWREDRRFRPHLTAVRLGRGLSSGELEIPVSPAAAFDGESVTLYRSLLLPEGAQYEPLIEVEL